MADLPTAGSKIRIVIEDTVESTDSGTLRTTGGVYIESLGQPGAATIEVLEPGWQLGDIVHDGRDQLVRIDKGDGVHVWQRPNGYVTYDDETSLASLRTIHQATQKPPVVAVDQSTRSELGQFVGCSRCRNGEWSGKAEERGWTHQGTDSWICDQHPAQSATTP